MKAKLTRRTDVYSILYNDEKYTLTVSEDEDGCNGEQLIDSNLDYVEQDLFDEIMKEFWELYNEI